MTNNSPPPDRILRAGETADRVGLTNRHLRNLERIGAFPKRIKLTPDGRACGHLESEVTAWMASRAAERQA